MTDWGNRRGVRTLGRGRGLKLAGRPEAPLGMWAYGAGPGQPQGGCTGSRDALQVEDAQPGRYEVQTKEERGS